MMSAERSEEMLSKSSVLTLLPWRLSAQLLKGAYTPDTPAALVYKATWPEEKVVRCTVGTLAQAGRDHHISKTALVLVGDFLSHQYQRSLLYHPGFSTEYRTGDGSAEPGGSL